MKKRIFLLLLSLNYLLQSPAQDCNFSFVPHGMNSILFQIYNWNDSLNFFGITIPQKFDNFTFKNIQVNYQQSLKNIQYQYNFLDSFVGYWSEYSNVLRVKNSFVYVTWGVRTSAKGITKQVFLKTDLNGNIENYQSV